MVVRSGTATSFLIDFSSGHPDAGVTWVVRGPDGTSMATGALPVVAGAVSATLTVPAVDNTLTVNQLTSFRDVEWSYTVSGTVINGSARYVIEARIPFGVSAAGVRTKLGIDDPEDLPDEEISLVRAYMTFVSNVTAPVAAQADPSDPTIRDAIEALAAVRLIPTLSVRIAQKENSGTSSYQRQTIDWAGLTASLSAMVVAAYVELVTGFDDTSSFTSLFILATPEADPITGQPYA